MLTKMGKTLFLTFLRLSAAPLALLKDAIGAATAASQRCTP